MTRLPVVKPKDALRVLEAVGFVLHHVRGSHHYFKHPNNPTQRVTVPVHRRDLKPGTLHRIIKDASLTVEEFLKLL